MLALITVVFTWQQDARQQRIEDQRAKAERELAEQRAQDEALQAYLDQMSTLLLEKDLRGSEESSEVRTLARARTLTVLERLSSSRKANAMRFLLEANLVRSVDGRYPVIELSDADFSDVDLTDADFSEANDLGSADLSNANLSGANLHDADLRSANLSDANLLRTDLSDADLRAAYLSDANLREANLSGAKLGGADLSKASLDTALGISNEQLEQQAYSLKGATMPTGQKYEDWLKSKSHGEDGESGG